MKRLMIPMAAISLLLLFTGCGQSGPLFVPGNPSTMAVPPSTNNADNDEQDEQDDGGDSSESD